MTGKAKRGFPTSRTEVLDKYLEQTPPETGIMESSQYHVAPGEQSNECLAMVQRRLSRGKSIEALDDRHSDKEDETGAVGLIVAQSEVHQSQFLK